MSKLFNSSHLCRYAGVSALFRAEYGLESNLLNFHAEVVAAALYQEITVHAPLWTVRVTNDPVAGARLLFFAPADDDD